MAVAKGNRIKADEVAGLNKVNIFTDNLYRKNINSDASITPSSDIHTYFIISRDKNNHDMSFIEQIEDTNGYTVLNLYTTTRYSLSSSALIQKLQSRMNR